MRFKISTYFPSLFHNKSVPFKISTYLPSLFHNKSVPFKISTYFPSLFYNKSVPFKKSSYLPSFFFTKDVVLIYITDILNFKKSTYYFGISSSLDNLFIHLWHLPPHQRFHLLFGWSSTSWSVKQATSLQ